MPLYESKKALAAYCLAAYAASALPSLKQSKVEKHGRNDKVL